MAPRFLSRLRAARDELDALARAFRHPGTPWYAKAWLLVVVAYAVSPIDLIPDFIPVLGLLDDAILLPLGIVVARRMIPDDVLAECRAAVDDGTTSRLRWIGVALVAAAWTVSAVVVVLVVRRIAD